MNMLVDIATEWNLKGSAQGIRGGDRGCRYSNRMEFKVQYRLNHVRVKQVDIATEWNLKGKTEMEMNMIGYSRYSNRMEFKAMFFSNEL